MNVWQHVLMDLLILSLRYASRIAQRAIMQKLPNNNVGYHVNLNMPWILIEYV